MYQINDNELLYLIYDGQEDAIGILFEKYTERRAEKTRNNFRSVMSYFKTMNDFYVEVNWEIHIPVLSFLCPRDKIKVCKFK